MEPTPSTNAPHTPPLPRHPLALAFCGAAFAGVVTLTVLTKQAPSEIDTPSSPSVLASPRPSTSRDVVRASFFDSEVEPRIAETDNLNRLAAERCVERISGLVDRYKAGVPPFVDDLTSLSTRLGIVRRLPGDWWNGDERIEVYVQTKFERNLFSEMLLTQDVAKVLSDFRDEVDANQKRMLVTVKASLDTADLPEVDISHYQPFFRSVSKDLNGYSAQQGTASVYNGLTVLVTSEIGSYVAISVAGGLLARVGTSVAAGAVAGVGATAGATATGAGGGTFVGPVGTIVGFGVGLAVGLVIDWWMTEKFESELTAQMEQYLDSLRNSLLHGSDNATINHGGLIEALPTLCDRLTMAYRERFYEQIVIVESVQ